MNASEQTRRVQVIAPSRLHFGLLAFGQSEGRQYGGVGVMVRDPGLQLSFLPSRELECSGNLANRVHAFVERWCRWRGDEQLPKCQIKVDSIPREHVGLGVGTQLGLSVAAGLNCWTGCPHESVADLAASVGRGLRSAVGSHGFCSGGLIVDAGKLAGEQMSQLQDRLDFPPAWHFVLISPREGAGLSGERETTAFAGLPAVPRDVTRRLQQEIDQEIIPAVQDDQFARFSQAIYRFGELAGSCFGSVQGGAYHGETLIQRVAWIRSLGVEGVGQSSWGPTLFALFPGVHEANDFVQYAERDPRGAELEYQVTAALNRGAQVMDGTC